MARLNKTREEKLQPYRINYAISEITKLGYVMTHINEVKIEFVHKGEKVHFFPYSGWATGKSIKDGRGLKHLINQLTK